MDKKESSKKKVFLYQRHPLMALGSQAVIEKEEDLEFCGSTGNHRTVIDEMRAVGTPDALIIDASLYAAESVGFIEKIRREMPGLRIILLSVHTSGDYVAKAERAGVNAYVLKTEDPSTMIEAVRAALAGKTYVSPGISAPGLKSVHPVDSPINLLDTRQFEILQRIGKGESNRQISDALQLSIDIVKKEVSAIEHILGLQNFAELIQFAFHWVHHEGGFS